MQPLDVWHMDVDAKGSMLVNLISPGKGIVETLAASSDGATL